MVGPDAAAVAVRLSVAMSRLRSRLRLEGGLTSSGLTISQLAVLHRLLEHGPATASTIAAAEHVSQQAVAQSLAVLRDAGLVQSRRDSTDARKMLVSATTNGEELFTSLMAARESWLIQAVDGLCSEQEIECLERAAALLERLAAARQSIGSYRP